MKFKLNLIRITPFLIGLIGATASASAPFAKTAAPAFYRIMVGDFEVTSISDGTVELPMSTLLTPGKPEDTKAALAKHFLAEPFETSDNSFLINTGTKLVLVDTGAGKLFGPTLGKFVTNFKASGYSPEQVDIILITHMHPDHVGGLTEEGKRVFPNATVWADKAESAYWLSPENLAKASKDNVGFFKGASDSLSPYVKAEKTKWIDQNTEVVPGIRTEASHGHTPGHTTYVVESKGQKLVLWGDLLHVGSLQFQNPGIGIKFDSDGKAAGTQRVHAIADAAKNGYLIGVTHLPFPGMGHVSAEGKKYSFTPLNYTQLK